MYGRRHAIKTSDSNLPTHYVFSQSRVVLCLEVEV